MHTQKYYIDEFFIESSRSIQRFNRVIDLDYKCISLETDVGDSYLPCMKLHYKLQYQRVYAGERHINCTFIC